MEFKWISEYDVEVSNLSEAIALASEWRNEGKFDWFRGQSEDWPLLSTLIRSIKHGEYNKSELQVHHLLNWFRRHKSFKSLLDQKDAFWAIAQHYGLPTNFLDFTTDPIIAGFFARPRKQLSRDNKGCIFCFSTKDFSEFKEFILKGDPKHPIGEIEMLDIKVDNLWRHQAQSGKFLFLPLEGFQKLYTVERIIFKHEEIITSPISPSNVYPLRKSSLEIALDEFFEEQRILVRQENFRRIFAPNFFKVHTLNFPKNYAPELFNSGKLSRHSSWQKKKIILWHKIKTVEYKAYYKNQKLIQLNLGSCRDAHLIEQTIRNSISVLDDKVRLLKWKCKFEGINDYSFTRKLNSCLNRLWEALTYYPYSDEDKTLALIKTIELALIVKDQGKSLGYEHNIRDSLTENNSNLILVDVGKDSGAAFNKVLISPEVFEKCIRNNIWDYVKGDYRPSPDKKQQMQNFLMAVRNPSYLFQFTKFKEAFAREVIPYQIITQSPQKSAIFYNPAEVDVFGLS